MRTLLPCVMACGLLYAAEIVLAVGPSTLLARQEAPKSAPKGTSEVSGVVLSANTGQPVRRATVNLEVTVGEAGSGTHATLTQTTDDMGAFRFQGLAEGTYHLSASKFGYLGAGFGEKRPGAGAPDVAIVLGKAQRREGLTITIPRGGALGGTVVDDRGEPAAGFQVRALRYSVRDGSRSIEPFGVAHVDDRGLYRLFGLPPGEYILMSVHPADVAQPSANSMILVGAASSTEVDLVLAERKKPAEQMPPLSVWTSRSGYSPVYYPGTSLPSAAVPITLGLGEERVGLDFHFQSTPLGRVTGTVSGTSFPEAVELQLDEATDVVLGMGVRRTYAKIDGSFVFPGVAPGRYVVRARAGGRVHVGLEAGGLRRFDPRLLSGLAEGLWASAEAVVDGLTDSVVSLGLRRGVAVAGRLQFRGSQRPTPRGRVHVRLNPYGSNRVQESAIASVGSSGEFEIAGVAPGKYTVDVLGLPGMVPESFDLAGRDALDFMLEVGDVDLKGAVLTMTDRLSSLTGSLLDNTGVATSEYMIVLTPADSRYIVPDSRRVRSMRPSTDGSFAFHGLPAGEYWVAVVDATNLFQYFEKGFHRQLASAGLGITLRYQEVKVQHLQVTSQTIR